MIEQVRHFLGAIQGLTKQHFPEGPVEMDVDDHPEFSSEEFFVLSVSASGSTSEIVDRECKWHRDVYEIVVDESDAFRLLVRAVTCSP